LNNSILIDSLNYRWKKRNGIYYFGTDWGQMFSPFNSAERKQYLRPFVTSLILFDEIYITTQHLEEFIALFGIKDAHFLFTNNCIKIIDDGGTSVGFLPNEGNNLLMNFSEGSFLKIDAIEKRLLEQYKGQSERLLLKPLMFKVESIKTEIDGAWFGHLAQQEICADFRNKNVTEFLRFQNNYDNTIVKNEDIVPLMRLNYANKSLIYQSELNIKNLSTESSIQNLVNIKVSPFINQKKSEPLELFSNIINDKQIPDLTDLYTRHLITIEEIISLKNDISGKKFRDWFESSDYDKAKIYRELLSRPKGITDLILTKFVRWSIPTLTGIINPILGAAAALVDSFIVDKILKGWHPNFFLDDVLSAKISLVLKEQEQLKRINLIESKFGRKIGRNELCPCESGNKYKNCCMKK